MCNFFFISALIFILASTGQAQIPSFPQIISECDYCGCSQGISPLETGSTGIRYEFRSLALGAQYTGSQKQPNPFDESENFTTNQLTLFYHISPEVPITLSVSLPYVSRVAEEAEDNGLLASTKTSGIGDIIFFARYHHHHYSDEATIGLSFGAGIKLPTGRADITGIDGALIDPDLRPGTGTTDILLSISGLWSVDKLGFSGNLDGGIITGRGAQMDSGGYHKYGNWINGDITARYRIVPNDISESNLYLLLGLGAEYRAHETLGSDEIAVSGGSIIYLASGLRYIISTAIAADASIQIPLYQNLGFDPADPSSNQRGQKFRIVAGLQYNIPSHI
jgi:hypothetical protein